MFRFRRMPSLQKIAIVHCSLCNHYKSDRSLSGRDADKQAHAGAPR